MSFFSNVTCGVERHGAFGKPGMWRVVVCALGFIPADACIFNAVMDDYGTLVRVS